MCINIKFVLEQISALKSVTAAVNCRESFCMKTAASANILTELLTM